MPCINLPVDLYGEMWRLVLIVCCARAGAWVFTDVRPRPGEEQLYKMLGENMSAEAFQDVLNARFSLIFPGTKWCGAGDVASGYEDLGPEEATDRCCRAHDHCPDALASGDTIHGLTNDWWFTRLSCDCDLRFRQCLHEADTQSANTVGFMYFSLMENQCFKDDYPIVGCKTRGGAFNRRCLEYELDESGQRRFQWFDVPLY